MIKQYRGGKYSNNLIGDGYYKNNSAGNPRIIKPNEAGMKREFKGSDTHEYTFADKLHGTHTITAKNFEDALRIAKSFGYVRANYVKR